VLDETLQAHSNHELCHHTDDVTQHYEYSAGSARLAQLTMNSATTPMTSHNTLQAVLDETRKSQTAASRIEELEARTIAVEAESKAATIASDAARAQACDRVLLTSAFTLLEA
jgi:hypothetical protein